MNPKRLALSLLTLALSGLGAQAQSLESWLPSAAQVAPVLQASPQIHAARARQQAQQQLADGVETGNAEWTLRLNQQRRRIPDTQERFGETNLSMERPLRLWGKAAMDNRLAEQDREVARIGLADALHEASRQLLTDWFAALRARLDLDSAHREWQLARELDRQAQVRLRHGDISRLDARLAQAEVQRSEAHARLMEAEQTRHMARFQHVYPGLPEPRWPEAEAALPPLPGESLTSALEDFLAHHHELQLLRAEAKRQQQLAERMERDRWPDPTVGVYAARERAGAEHVLGVSLSVPLSGRWRDSQARAALAQAQVLTHQVQELERRLGAEFEARWSQRVQQQQALVALRAASLTQTEAAEKSLTAYTLGEHSMTELIQNRRLAHEHQLASQRLLLETVLQHALIELDAHRLWDLDD